MNGIEEVKGTLEGIAGFELTAGVVEAAELDGDLQWPSACNDLELVLFEKRNKGGVTGHIRRDYDES